MPSTALEVYGYADRCSVRQNDSIGFCLSSLTGDSVRNVTVVIVRLGLVETPVLSATVDVHAHPLPTQPWLGHAWPVTLEVRIDPDWSPGVYVLRPGSASGIYFIVRSSGDWPRPGVVLQMPTNTVNAYNNWGGKSLYGYNSGNQPARIVSFNRPQVSHRTWPRGFGFQHEWEERVEPLALWLERAGIRAEVIANNDLHEDADVLAGRQLFISAGHDEYWTAEMRDRVDRFVAAGGNVAVLGGNTCFWRARLEPDQLSDDAARMLVCYRDASEDPVADPRDKTITWAAAGLPENTTFGAGFQSGAWKGSGTGGAFRICDPEHWLFEGFDRVPEVFGNAADEPLLTYETNGVDWRAGAGGRPLPTGVDGTPDTYVIAALAELPDWEKPGNAAMGVFTKPGGGTVFNAATTEWARGLAPCARDGDLYATTTAKITRNVIARLAPERRSLARSGR